MRRVDLEQIEVVALCDIGQLRSSNQDATAEGSSAAGVRWVMVADGMGGHAGGETASRLAVETVGAVLADGQGSPDTALRAAFEAANRAVFEEAQRDARLAGMGTTGVAVAFAASGAACVANVGDSRAYLLRDGALEQITSDHSLVAELQRRGVLTEEQARVHPRRNEVLRSLGIEPQVVVDLHPVELRSGDVFLLCSDGLTGVVRDEALSDALRSEPPDRAADTLVAAANEAGGPDNISVAIARIPELAEGAPAESAGGAQFGRALGLALLVVAAGLLLLWL